MFARPYLPLVPKVPKAWTFSNEVGRGYVDLKYQIVSSYTRSVDVRAMKEKPTELLLLHLLIHGAVPVLGQRPVYAFSAHCVVPLEVGVQWTW